MLWEENISVNNNLCSIDTFIIYIQYKNFMCQDSFIFSPKTAYIFHPYLNMLLTWQDREICDLLVTFSSY